MRVILKEEAFCTIVISSVNTYHREWYGLLVGHTDTDEFYIESVIPILAVRSGYEYVFPHQEKLKIVRRIVPTLILGREMLGDVHSHPGRNNDRAFPKPSKADVEESTIGEVYLIAGINPKKHHRAWKANADGRLSGTVGDFHIKLTAYHLTGTGDHNWAWAPIICPFAVGLGRGGQSWI